MQVKFTDVYDQNCQGKFQITREQVRETINNPDSQQTIRLDELELGFFVKQMVRPPGEFFVLACARKDSDKWFVDLGFRVLPSLVVGLGTLEPLMLLQHLVQRFGLTIKISHQLNKFIFREEIAIERKISDPTKIVEVLNPSNHTFIQTIFIRIDNRDDKQVVSCALAYAIDADEYAAWLFGRRADQEVIIDIAPQLGGHATPRDFIKSTGTMTFWTNYSELGLEKEGFLFRVLTKGYHFEAGFTSTHFYIVRNHERLEIALEPIYKPTGKVFCVAGWTPSQLTLTLLDEAYEEALTGSSVEDQAKETQRRTRILATPPTLPPNSLVVWARKETIAPTTIYNSPGQFYQTIFDALQSIEDKVSTLGLYNPFWNITYEGATIVARRPKREPDIHPTIHGFLFDIAVAKNLEVAPEYPIAGGRLDFLISGVLNTGKVISACVEFKHAHSGDQLLHGLLKQLPTYMQAKGSDYGVYCVMYFKGSYFDEPRDYDKRSLQLFLARESSAAGLINIRELTLDFSHTKPPSKV